MTFLVDWCDQTGGLVEPDIDSVRNTDECKGVMTENN